METRKKKTIKTNKKKLLQAEARYYEEQNNAGILGSLPAELLSKEVAKYLSYADMGKLRSTCRFFSKHISLKEEFNKGKPWKIFAKAHHIYFMSGRGQVYMLKGFLYKTPLPISLNNKEAIARVIVGHEQTFFVDVDGNYYVHGLNCAGEVGLGTDIKIKDNMPASFNLPNDKEIVDVIAGEYTSFILDIEGKWYACGQNNEGQLGIHLSPYERQRGSKCQYIPTRVVLPNHSPITKVVSTLSCTFFQDKKGDWYGCGWNGLGQLGVQTEQRVIYEPILITLPNQKAIVDIVVGCNHTFIKDEEGNWYGCGDNEYGQLGITKTQLKYSWERVLKPILISLPNNKPISKITTYKNQTFFQDVDGDWHACGQNYSGQLGLGHSKEVSTPEKICFPEGVSIINVEVGSDFTFFEDTKHRWYGCGCNKNKKFGFEPCKDILTPMLIDFSYFKNNNVPNSEGISTLEYEQQFKYTF